MASKVASPSEKISDSVVSGDVQIAFADAHDSLKSRIRLEFDVRVNFFWLFSVLPTSSDFYHIPIQGSGISGASAYSSCCFPKPSDYGQFSGRVSHFEALGFSFRSFLSKLDFTGHQASGYCLGLGCAERVGGIGLLSVSFTGHKLFLRFR